MQYLGSKRRIAAELVAIITKYRTQNQCYVEPFVGSASVISGIAGPRVGSDSHYYLISLLQSVQSGWVPPRTVTEVLYNSVKAHPEDYSPALVGFIGFACSFAGKWFAGFARNTRSYNYAAGGCNTLLKLAPLIQDVQFVHSDYASLHIPCGSLIYCDPPYRDTTKYSADIDHNAFWDWCVDKAQSGHTVLVSEYAAPPEFVEVWRKDLIITTNKNQKSARTERLFIHHSNL